MQSQALQLCERLCLMVYGFMSLLDGLAAEQNLTRPQMYALYLLETRGTLSMGSVADALQCDASNVTGIVDRLLTRQLVDRTEDSHDRRIKYLALTSTGHEMIRVIMKKMPHTLSIDTFSIAELQQLDHLLQKLSAKQIQHV